METDIVKISWTEVSGKKCLKFIFSGRLTEAAATDAIKIWKQEFQHSSQEKIYIIWDCIHMANYDTPARKIWQQTLSELKSKIAEICLITNSQLIKTAASVMGLLIRVKISAVSEEKQAFTK